MNHSVVVVAPDTASALSVGVGVLGTMSALSVGAGALGVTSSLTAGAGALGVASGLFVGVMVSDGAGLVVWVTADPSLPVAITPGSGGRLSSVTMTDAQPPLSAGLAWTEGDGVVVTVRVGPQPDESPATSMIAAAAIGHGLILLFCVISVLSQHGSFYMFPSQMRGRISAVFGYLHHSMAMKEIVIQAVTLK
jgi:hypothetical protein